MVDEDEKQGQTAEQINPEIAPAPLMEIGMKTAAARALWVSAHRKNIAMCIAHSCEAHDRPEPSMTFATHVITCNIRPVFSSYNWGLLCRFHFQLFYV